MFLKSLNFLQSHIRISVPFFNAEKSILKESTKCSSEAVSHLENTIIAAKSFSKLENQMYRSFRLDQVLCKCNEGDIVVARQENNRFSYIGFKDVASLDVARCLLLIPSSYRHFHTVCAREGSIVDYYADVDLPLNENGEEIILQITDRLFDKLDSMSFGPRSLIILQSIHSDKLSFHIHIKGHESAFDNFRALRHISDEINRDMDREVIDLACYRNCGTLRTAYSAKLKNKGRVLDSISDNCSYESQNHLLPVVDAKDPELSLRLQDMAAMPPVEILSASLVTRQMTASNTPIRLFSSIGEITKNKSSKVKNDCKDNISFFSEELKWLRYKQAVKKLRTIPLSVAENYDTWIRVGLALYSFGSDNHIFEEWCRFSLCCPQKFNRDACFKKWTNFSGNSDQRNWGRGYNYLTSTLWREIGIVSSKYR